ncbi:MAG: transglutaminase domain-containing protein [Promethearchaeota archaeon]
MSEIKEKLLGSKNVRNDVLKVVALSVVLVFAFAFSTFLISLLFDSLRIIPSKQNPDFEEQVLVPIYPPFDLSDLDPDLLEQILEMFDGDFDDLPLEDLSDLMNESLFSELAQREVFRVFNYSSFLDVDDYLWKYECFDTYSSGTWSASSGFFDNDFAPLSKYSNPLIKPEILLMKMLNLSVINDPLGNLFTAPTLFPKPYIIENSIMAPFLTSSSLRTQEEGLNGSSILSHFSQNNKLNLTYQLLGENLPSDADINSSCVIVTSPDPDYISLTNDYLRLDGSIANFLANHNDFRAVYNYLDNNVINTATDNAFIIADKIRNYLQYNFNLTYNPVPAAEADQDPINWFCKSREGMYSEFASAFIALTRAFGVVSRFVDGFNSRFVEQVLDPTEGIGFAVKYQNIYSWAEVFIPTDITGNGYWAQIDVLFENFMGNPVIPVFGNVSYSLNVTCDGLAPPSYPIVNRGVWVNVTATLYNESLPMENKTITFTDITSGMTIGSNDTNSNGKASVYVYVNDSLVVGPHVIVAQYNPQVANIGNFVINDTIIVNLTGISPSSINVSDPSNNSIRAWGKVFDPKNDLGVPYSIVNFTLLYNGTSTYVPNAFNPPSITTDENGVFDTYLQGDPAYVFSGDYEVRADINGSYYYTVLWYGYEYNFSIPLGPPAWFLSNSSQTKELHIDKELTGSVLFYIENTPSNYPYTPVTAPVVPRGTALTLKARVLNETGGPLPNITVNFFNYTGGDMLIGSNDTNQNGITTLRIIAGDSCLVGPNLLYAKAGNIYNYSYYILNEDPVITVVSGPEPRVINKTTGQPFTIVGYINDSVNLTPLNYSEVELRIFKNGYDNTSYLIGTNPFSVDSNGKFSVLFYVDNAIAPGNYTLRLDFNGTFDLTTFPYGNDFDLPIISTSVTLNKQLQITYEAPTILNFWINGTTSDNYTNPSIPRYNDLNLTARLLLGDTPISGELIEFYDTTNNTLIGTDVTDINGYAMVIYSTNYYSIAGPHLLYARYTTNYNYSYFILNAPINVSLDPCPIPWHINSTTIQGRTFRITGDLIDGTNGAIISFGQIEINLLDGLTDYSNYLIKTGGSQQILNFFICNDTGEIYALFNVSSATPEKNYTIRVDFNGTIYYNHPIYAHTFYLQYLSDSMVCAYQLNVTNPLNTTIRLNVDGYPVPDIGIYPDGFLPPSVRLGENITFNGYVYDSSGPVSGKTIYLYDIYYNPSSWIMSDITDGSGYFNFELNTSGPPSFSPGLHLMKVVYDIYYNDVFNSTYIIINETSFTISINENLPVNEITRNGAGFNVWGVCSDGARYLRGLNVSLHLINSMGQDYSQYIEFIGNNYDYTDDNGYYSFSINRISLNCPQGSYTLRVDFNGSIFRDIDNPLVIGMSNAMSSLSSSSINLNITASTTIIEQSWYTDYEVPPYDLQWVYNTTLYVNGRLIWDNGTAIQNVYVTVVVQYLNGTNIATNSTVLTNSIGDFSGTFFIDLNWPDYRNETEIWVYYTPVEDYVESDQLEFTDW